MKFMASIILVVMLYGVKYSQQQDLTDKKITLCGQNLATARALLCFGSQLVMKRSDKYVLTAPINDNVLMEEQQSWPWLLRNNALIRTGSWGRHKRSGLADECCLKPCTTSEILAYC